MTLSFSTAQNDGAGGGQPAEGDGRVSLRPPTAGDREEFVALARASVGLHHPWYAMPTTREDYQAYLARYSQPGTEGFLVCLRSGGALAGIVTIDSIIRGRFQSASLSYAAFAPAAGRGYMSEGLALVLRHAFQELRLHRLEANIQPANHASLRLIRRLGFSQEGYSPGMLFIDGAWRDHERWAITREMTGFPPVDPHPTSPPAEPGRGAEAGGVSRRRTGPGPGPRRCRR